MACSTQQAGLRGAAVLHQPAHAAMLLRPLGACNKVSMQRHSNARIHNSGWRYGWGCSGKHAALPGSRSTAAVIVVPLRAASCCSTIARQQQQHCAALRQHSVATAPQQTGHQHGRHRVAAAAAAAAAAGATTGAVGAAVGGLSAASGLLDMTAVSAASAASFKLLFLCGVVAWMSHRHMIPPNTSQVMSQIAFSVTIPAMLLASTTKTLTAAQPANLLAIPAIAVAQIALGAVFGRWAAAAVQGRWAVTRILLGWRELHPTVSAAAIAASTAAALRAPMAAPALLPPSSGIPPALPLLIELGCSFGNTVTLPLLYLMTMLPAADASRAAGFMSLFHAAWSPCLWVFGYSRVQDVSRGQQQLGVKRPKAGPLASLAALWRRLVAAARDTTKASSSSSAAGSSSSGGFSPPSSQPAVLITKQLPPAAAGAAGAGGQAGRAPVFAVQSSEEEDDLPDDETPAERLVKRFWRVLQVLLRTELVQKLTKAINPPVTAVFAGLALGLSPAGLLLCDASAAASFVSQHSSSPFVAWELSLLLGILRCCWETVELMASGTLALQALVLAASLFATQPPASKSSSSNSRSSAAADEAADTDNAQGEGLEGFTSEGPSGFSSSSSSSSSTAKGTVELVSPGGGRSDLDQPLVLGSTGIMSCGVGSFSSSSSGGGSSIINVTHAPARTADDASASVLNQLKPQNEWEWRAMLAVAAVRFVLLPSVTCLLVLAAFRGGLLPPDPACAFMLLLQSCMPPAQNLVLMMQLQPGTASLAPATARLLLQMYTLAVLPVTLWVSVFAKLVL